MYDNGAFDLGSFAAATKELCGLGEIGCDVTARSILGREIPAFTLGSGKKAVVYVGALCGTEALVSGMLLDFIEDYVKRYQKDSKVFDVAMQYLFRERRIIVVPMLNPDGVDYATKGVSEDNPIRTRVLQMNGGEDFSLWRANARGVDLSHNFDAGYAAHKNGERARGILNGAPFGYGGEYPESEPESAALCRMLRFLGEDLLGVIELHLGHGEIFCSCKDNLSAKTMAAGRILGRATGYRLIGPEKALPQGGLADWCIEKLYRPAYRVDCDAAKYAPDKARACLFEAMRRALYTFPFML